MYRPFTNQPSRPRPFARILGSALEWKSVSYDLTFQADRERLLCFVIIKNDCRTRSTLLCNTIVDKILTGCVGLRSKSGWASGGQKSRTQGYPEVWRLGYTMISLVELNSHHARMHDQLPTNYIAVRRARSCRIQKPGASNPSALTQ